MALPVGEIGASAIGGGAVVAFVMKLLPILLKKFNGRNRNNKNTVKPGEAKICRDRGEKVAQHDTAIVGLCGSITRIEGQMETARTENREDHGKMFEKLDGLKK